MLEYLIMTILVAFLVFSALNMKNSKSIVSTTMDQAQRYYIQGYNLIKGGHSPEINGGWCEWSACIKVDGATQGYQERSCACPRPAGGGKCPSGLSYQKCALP